MGWGPGTGRCKGRTGWDALSAWGDSEDSGIRTEVFASVLLRLFREEVKSRGISGVFRRPRDLGSSTESAGRADKETTK